MQCSAPPLNWVWLYSLTSAEEPGKILHQAEKRPGCHNFAGPRRCRVLRSTCGNSLYSQPPRAKNSHLGARLVTTGSFSLILLFLRWSHSQTRSRKNYPLPNTAWASLPLLWVASTRRFGSRLGSRRERGARVGFRRSSTSAFTCVPGLNFQSFLPL